ncbi:kin of IRRE-like protein 2 [Penaeus chinensis]|uniref:kin of IRRE-like protein 2 n=1 Tax=Penaeus chinensis TaxID=139456 RepID=UPI001FB581AE|nr:kin of IRRE-like protein 2 [Penaeus chinensis]
MELPTVKNSQPMAVFQLTVFVFLFIGKGSVAGMQKFLVRPESAEVKEGQDVLLRCAVDNQKGKVQWTKDGFALGFERHVPGYPRYQYTGDPELGEHNLVIKGVTLTEDGEYQCQVGPTNDNPPIWAAANVTVLREYHGREDMWPLEVGILSAERDEEYAV